MKTCTQCRVAKPLEGYHKHATGKHGRRSRCKACVAAVDNPRSTKPKVCLKCDKLKPAEEFATKKSSPTGLHCWCKECGKAPRDHSPDLDLAEPWRKLGYTAGQFVCGNIELLYPGWNGRERAAWCRCHGCGAEYWLSYSTLVNGHRHQCMKLTDYAGFRTAGYQVVEKQWHEESLHWLVRLEGGEKRLVPHKTVRADVTGDLKELSDACSLAVRIAAKEGRELPLLKLIGVTVEEVQFYLPLAHRRSARDHLGHIFSRKHCLTPEAVVASWHPANLRWTDPTFNSQLNSLIWSSKLADPVSHAHCVWLCAKWWADLNQQHPDGIGRRDKLAGGKITPAKRALVGMPSREEELATAKAEINRVASLYEGYAE